MSETELEEQKNPPSDPCCTCAETPHLKGCPRAHGYQKSERELAKAAQQATIEGDPRAQANPLPRMSRPE